MNIPVITLLGRMTLALLATIGAVSYFAAEAVREAVQPPYYRRQIVRQMLEMGVTALALPRYPPRPNPSSRVRSRL